MGGEDLMDKSDVTTLKPTTEILRHLFFYHLVDMAATNAYIWYRLISNNDKENPKKVTTRPKPNSFAKKCYLFNKK